ncbi:hypothetical protein GCM10027610_135410 [Dactylosporangium cerinum]
MLHPLRQVGAAGLADLAGQDDQLRVEHQPDRRHPEEIRRASSSRKGLPAVPAAMAALIASPAPAALNPWDLATVLTAAASVSIRKPLFARRDASRLTCVPATGR